MMFATSLLVLAFQTPALPPRPSDEDLLSTLRSERPAGDVLSVDFQDASRGGGRVGCGTMAINEVVEPFAVLTAWNDPGGRPVVRIDGAPPPPVEAPAWKIRVSAPKVGDANADGLIDRHDRNADALQRRMATNICKTLTPPEGAIWTTELEPDPDPQRQARNERLARTMTDMIFAPDGEAAAAPASEDDR